MLTPLEYEDHAGLAYDLIRAIDEDRPVLIDGEAGRATMELIMAVYKSAAEGQAVKLPLKECSTLDFVGRFDHE